MMCAEEYATVYNWDYLSYQEMYIYSSAINYYCDNVLNNSNHACNKLYLSSK